MRLPIVAALLGAPLALYAQLPSTAVTGDVTVQVNQVVNSAGSRPNQVFMGVVSAAQGSNLNVGDKVGLAFQSGALHIVIAISGGRMQHMTSPAVSVASVPAGGTVCFSAKGSCGTGRSPTAAAIPTSPASSGAAAASGSQYLYVVEGIGLRMSLDQVRAAVKASGSTKPVHKQGPVTYDLETKDLLFQIQLTPDGHVRQYNVSDKNPRNITETMDSGPLYDKLVKAFGPKASWGKAVLYDLGEGGGAYAIVTDPSEL